MLWSIVLLLDFLDSYGFMPLTKPFVSNSTYYWQNVWKDCVSDFEFAMNHTINIVLSNLWAFSLFSVEEDGWGAEWCFGNQGRDRSEVSWAWLTGQFMQPQW